MRLKFKIFKLLYICSFIFGSISTPGNISNIFTLPLSALEIANSNGIGFENKSLSIIKHPSQINLERNNVGYSFNNLFSNEVSASTFQFLRKIKNQFSYQFGGIFISINDIPDTRDLFLKNDGLVPDYDLIENLNFNQYFFWMNFAKDLNLKSNIGFNIFPHFYQFDDIIGYGLLANISFTRQLTNFLNYSIILNSIPGSFSIWGNKNIEFYPLELRNNISFKYNKINLNSSLDYNSESINIFSSKFWTKDGFDYSISINYLINDNLQIILSNGDMITLGGGFIFEYQGVEIHYGAGKQKFDSISMLHQGIDLIIDLNRINEWQKILKP